MHALEASFTGTLRVIAILLLVWFVLRMLRRVQGPGAKGGFRSAPREDRPVGDVRIENLKSASREDKDQGGGPPITDADYEELK